MELLPTAPSRGGGEFGSNQFDETVRWRNVSKLQTQACLIWTAFVRPGGNPPLISPHWPPLRPTDWYSKGAEEMGEAGLI